MAEVSAAWQKLAGREPKEHLLPLAALGRLVFEHDRSGAAAPPELSDILAALRRAFEIASWDDFFRIRKLGPDAAEAVVLALPESGITRVLGQLLLEGWAGPASVKALESCHIEESPLAGSPGALLLALAGGAQEPFLALLLQALAPVGTLRAADVQRRYGGGPLHGIEGSWKVPAPGGEPVLEVRLPRTDPHTPEVFPGCVWLVAPDVRLPQVIWRVDYDIVDDAGQVAVRRR